MWQFDTVRFVVGFIILSIAATSDIRTRRVSDRLWMIMGGIAMAILATQMFVMEMDWRYFLIFVPIVVLLVEALVDVPELYPGGKLNVPVLGWLTLPFLTVTYQIYALGGDLTFWSLLSIPVMMVLAFVFYYIRLLYGGADAKAVLVLAVLVPFYPHIPGFTRTGMTYWQIQLMQIFFPFTMITLANACIILLALPVVYLFMNISRGDIAFPRMLFGYRKDVEDIPKSFVWPMERFDKNGKLVVKLFPKDDTDKVLEELIRGGKKRVWVHPKIPFIVSIFIGFIISYIWGNPIFHLIAYLH